MKKSQVKFSGIVWDDAGDANLPEEVVLEVDLTDGVDLSLEGSDILSDKFEFCVKEYSFEVLSPV